MAAQTASKGLASGHMRNGDMNHDCENPGDTWANSIGLRFASIPAGEFVMGSPAIEEGREDDETQHRVRISQPFLMQTTEVTQAQWRAVMGENQSHFEGDDLPVEEVSWDAAVAFCRNLTGKDGRTF